jgi:hypothetical protein
MAKPLINGTEYAFADVRIKIGNTEIVGCTAIDYNIAQAKENISGTGDQPVSRGRAEKIYTGTITLLGSELELLREQAVDGDITNLDVFEMQVSYAPKEITKLTTHILSNAEFLEDPSGGAAGDTSLPQAVPFIWAGKTKV